MGIACPEAEDRRGPQFAVAVMSRSIFRFPCQVVAEAMEPTAKVVQSALSTRAAQELAILAGLTRVRADEDRKERARRYLRTGRD